METLVKVRTVILHIILIILELAAIVILPILSLFFTVKLWGFLLKNFISLWDLIFPTPPTLQNFLRLMDILGGFYLLLLVSAGIVGFGVRIFFPAKVANPSPDNRAITDISIFIMFIIALFLAPVLSVWVTGSNTAYLSIFSWNSPIRFSLFWLKLIGSIAALGVGMTLAKIIGYIIFFGGFYEGVNAIYKVGKFLRKKVEKPDEVKVNTILDK